jgi:predicted nucleic acid-binding protein
MYLLHRAGGIRAQDELWGFLTDGLVRLHVPSDSEWRRLRELMQQYADMPLDMADASLVSAAEQLGDRRLFSLDQRLRAVRVANQQVFDVLP